MQLFDTSLGWRFVNPKMKEKYGTDSMGQTAENVAEHDGDHPRGPGRVCGAVAAEGRGRPRPPAGSRGRSLPVEIAAAKGKPAVVVEQDEFIRPDTTLEMLAKLKPAFRTDGKGSVTAGNSSGLNDGAGALLIASEAGLKEMGAHAARAHRGLGGRRRGAAHHGNRPGARNAARCSRRPGLTLDQIDVIELNEAFAAQSLGCLRELGLADDDPRVNPNGGAIALGHPLGMSRRAHCCSPRRTSWWSGRPLRALHDVHRRGAGDGGHH